MKLLTGMKTLILLLTLAGAAPAQAGDAAVPAATGGAPMSSAAARLAASQPSPQLAAFRQAIRAKYDLKERAFGAHDAETIVTRFYARDVISVGAGEGIFIGREQIRPLYAEVVKSNTVKIESVYTFVDGNAGWDWADFHVMPTDGKTAPFTFAILFLWAKEHGEWMCRGDFFLVGSMKAGKLAPEPAAPAG
jgi:ketosteroid isomerase-like protein